MKFKILNIEISVSVLFCVLITFLLILDSTGLMSISLLTVLVHELGHLACMKKLNCYPKAFNLTLYGVFIVSPSVYSNENEKMFVALSGPLVNLALFIIFYFINFVIRSDYLLKFSLVNFIFFLMNMLPINGLDGGTITECLFIKKLGVSKGQKYAHIVSLLVVFVVLMFGIFILMKNYKNITLLLLGIYLFVLNIIKV